MFLEEKKKDVAKGILKKLDSSYSEISTVYETAFNGLMKMSLKSLDALMAMVMSKR